MPNESQTFLRTCQECGNKQWDKDPTEMTEAQFNSYQERKCKKCKSEGSLDYGYEAANVDTTLGLDDDDV